MRISFRPSGGRGEYELAGTGIHPITESTVGIDDLFGKRILVQTPLGGVVDSGTECLRLDGKPRIRLTEDNPNRRYAHTPSIIASLLLLPNPARSITSAHGTGFVFDNYYLSDIEFDIIEIGPTFVKIDPTEISGSYSNGEKYTIGPEDLESRKSGIFLAMNDLNFASVRDLDPTWTDVKNRFKTAIMSASQINDIRVLELLVKTLWEKAGHSDPVQDLVQPTENPSLNKPNPSDSLEIKLRNIAECRKALTKRRGGKEKRFSEEVRHKYGNGCSVCGMRLPKLGKGTKAGVDAAHILPWSEYDLDVVKNGLCLCKHHHWAFDEFLFTVEYDPKADNYLLVTTPELAKRRGSDHEYCEELHRRHGTSLVNLPSAPEDRPSPVVLDAYRVWAFS